MNSQDMKKFNIPDNPGVYFFKKGGIILYIGKATSLKDRVKSYFSRDLIVTRGAVILDMVFQADSLDYIKTDSVLEALILENNLIKKYQPKYNTKEKDDKSFNYVVITDEDFPRVLVERGRNIDLNRGKRFDLESQKRSNLEERTKCIFGPYPNDTQLKEALKIVRKIFPFRDRCIPAQGKPCFNRQIGLCPGVCDGSINKKDYKKIIKNIVLFFEGKKEKILKNLEKEMKNLAKRQEFEKADKIKRTIFALQHIQDIALVKSETFSGKRFDLESQKRSNLEEEKVFRIEAYDVAHFSGESNVGVMVVLENGIANKNEYRIFKINNSKQNDIKALKEILERRLTHEEWRFPDLIVVDGGKAQITVARKVFENLLGSEASKLGIVSVVKNERHRASQILGDSNLARKHEQEILLANNEAHRFAIKYHRQSLLKSSLE